MTISKSPEALRKAKSRELAKVQFGTVTYTFELTEREQMSVKRHLLAKFGHDGSITSRKARLAKQTEQGVVQAELFGLESNQGITNVPSVAR
ncbi:MAG: hypothetical protein HZA32_16775 [Opitutae bacterium]|nr:hypothetical protein [Opitutae bacterium]